MEEEIASNVVSSPSHSLVPIVGINSPFVFNSSVHSSPAFLSEALVVNSQVAEDDFGSEVVATTSNSSDMAQKSLGNRCLKPFQKLKDMEWFTIGGKTRSGRGNPASSRRFH